MGKLRLKGRKGPSTAKGFATQCPGVARLKAHVFSSMETLGPGWGGTASCERARGLPGGAADVFTHGARWASSEDGLVNKQLA